MGTARKVIGWVWLIGPLLLLIGHIWNSTQIDFVSLSYYAVSWGSLAMSRAVGEVALPGYAQFAGDGELSRRIADVLTCNVSTRKYTRVMYRCAEEMGISRSAVSRHFVKDSAQALAKLMSRNFDKTDRVAIYVDGIIVARHHLIAAIGVSILMQRQRPSWRRPITSTPRAWERATRFPTG